MSALLNSLAASAFVGFAFCGWRVAVTAESFTVTGVASIWTAASMVTAFLLLARLFGWVE